MNLIEITWRQLPDYPDYEISQDGRLRRCEPSKAYPVGYEHKAYRRRNGYLTYRLWDPVQERHIETGAHRLVALAFIGPPPSPSHEVHHRDNDKTNNIPPNLCWVKHAANMAATIGHGVSQPGASNPRSKLTPAQVRKIRRLCRSKKLTQRAVAKAFGVTQSTISLIATGKTYKQD